LLFPCIEAADDNPFLTSGSAPGVTAQQEQIAAAALIAPQLLEMEKKLADDLKGYQDENFMALDQRTSEFLKSFQTKAILGILGLNLLSVGIIFYIINKNQRKIAYESVSLRKRQGDEDRLHFVDTLNQIRAKVEFLEEEARKVKDTRVLPTQILEQEYGGAQYGREYGDGRGGSPQIDPWGNAVEEGPEYPPEYYDPATGEQLPWGAPREGEYPPEGFI
jgi:hypothetical protein